MTKEADFDRYAFNRWYYLVISIDSSFVNDTVYCFELRYVASQGHLHRKIGQVGPQLHKKQTTFVQPLYIPYYPHDQFQFVALPPSGWCPPSFATYDSCNAHAKAGPYHLGGDSKDRDRKYIPYESQIFTLDELLPHCSQYTRMKTLGKQLTNTIGKGHIYVNIFSSSYSPISSLSCFSIKLGLKMFQPESLASKFKKFSLSSRKKNNLQLADAEQQKKYRLVVYATSDYYMTRSSIGQLAEGGDSEHSFADYMMHYVIGGRFERGVLLFVSDNYLPSPFPTNQYPYHPSMASSQHPGGVGGLPSSSSMSTNTSSIAPSEGGLSNINAAASQPTSFLDHHHHHHHQSILSPSAIAIGSGQNTSNHNPYHGNNSNMTCGAGAGAGVNTHGIGAPSPTNHPGFSTPSKNTRSNYSFSFSNPRHATPIAATAGHPNTGYDGHDDTISSSSSSFTTTSSRIHGPPPPMQHQHPLPHVSFTPHGGYVFSFDTQLLKWLIPSENQVIRHTRPANPHNSNNNNNKTANTTGHGCSDNNDHTTHKEYLFSTNEKFILKDRELSQISLVFEVYDDDKLICSTEESLYHLIHPFIARNQELYPLFVARQQEVENALQQNPRLIAIPLTDNDDAKDISSFDEFTPHCTLHRDHGQVLSLSAKSVSVDEGNHHPNSAYDPYHLTKHQHQQQQQSLMNTHSNSNVYSSVPKEYMHDDPHDGYHQHHHNHHHNNHNNNNTSHVSTHTPRKLSTTPKSQYTRRDNSYRLLLQGSGATSTTSTTSAVIGNGSGNSSGGGGGGGIRASTTTTTTEYPHLHHNQLRESNILPPSTTASASSNQYTSRYTQRSNSITNTPTSHVHGLTPAPTPTQTPTTTQDLNDISIYPPGHNQPLFPHFPQLESLDVNHDMLDVDDLPSDDYFDDDDDDDDINIYSNGDGDGGGDYSHLHNRGIYGCQTSTHESSMNSSNNHHRLPRDGSTPGGIGDDDTNSNSISRHFRYDLTNLPLSPSSTATTSHRYSSHHPFSQRNSTSVLSPNESSLSPSSASVNTVNILRTSRDLSFSAGVPPTTQSMQLSDLSGSPVSSSNTVVPFDPSEHIPSLFSVPHEQANGGSVVAAEAATAVAVAVAGTGAEPPFKGTPLVHRQHSLRKQSSNDLASANAVKDGVLISHQRDVHHLLLSRRKSITSGPLRDSLSISCNSTHSSPQVTPKLTYDIPLLIPSSSSLQSITTENHLSTSTGITGVGVGGGGGGDKPSSGSAQHTSSPTLSSRSLAPSAHHSTATVSSSTNTSMPLSSVNAVNAPYNYGSILPTCFVTGGSDNMCFIRPQLALPTDGYGNTNAMSNGTGNGTGQPGGLHTLGATTTPPQGVRSTRGIAGSVFPLTPKSRPSPSTMAGGHNISSHDGVDTQANPPSSPLMKSPSRIALTRSSSHSTSGGIKSSSGLSLSYSIEHATSTTAIVMNDPPSMPSHHPGGAGAGDGASNTLTSNILPRTLSGTTPHPGGAGGVGGDVHPAKHGLDLLPHSHTNSSSAIQHPHHGNDTTYVRDPVYSTLQLPVHPAKNTSKAAKGVIYIHAVTHHHLPSFDEMIRQNNIVFRPLIVVDGYLHPSQFRPIKDEVIVDHKGVIVNHHHHHYHQQQQQQQQQHPLSPTFSSSSSSFLPSNPAAGTRPFQSPPPPPPQPPHPTPYSSISFLHPHLQDPYLLSIGKCKPSLIQSSQYLLLILYRFIRYCSFRTSPTSMDDVDAFFARYYSAFGLPLMRNPDLELPKSLSQRLPPYVGGATPQYTIESAGIPVIAANVYPPPHRVATRQLNTTRTYIHEYSEALHNQLMARNNHNINYSIYDFNAMVTGDCHPVLPSSSKCPGISRYGVVAGDGDYQYQLREAQLIPSPIDVDDGMLNNIDMNSGSGDGGDGSDLQSSSSSLHMVNSQSQSIKPPHDDTPASGNANQRSCTTSSPPAPGQSDTIVSSMYFIDDYLCQVYDTRQLATTSDYDNLDHPRSLPQLHAHIATMLKELSSYPTRFHPLSSLQQQQQQQGQSFAHSTHTTNLMQRHSSSPHLGGSPPSPMGNPSPPSVSPLVGSRSSLRSPQATPSPAHHDGGIIPEVSLNNLPLLLPPNQLSFTLDEDHTYLEETIIYIARMIVYRTLFDYNKKISEQIAVSRLNNTSKPPTSTTTTTSSSSSSSFNASTSHQSQTQSTKSRGVVEYYVAFITGTDFDALFPALPELPSTSSHTTPILPHARTLHEPGLPRSISGSSSCSSSSSHGYGFPASMDGISLMVPSTTSPHVSRDMPSSSLTAAVGSNSNINPNTGSNTNGVTLISGASSTIGMHPTICKESPQITPQLLYGHIDPVQLAQKRQEHVTKIMEIIQRYTSSLPISFVFLGNNEHDGLSLMDIDYHHYCYGVNSMLLSTSQQQQHYPHFRNHVFGSSHADKSRLFHQYTFDEVIDHVLYHNHLPPSQSSSSFPSAPPSASSPHRYGNTSSLYHHNNNKYDISTYGAEFLFRPRHNTIYLPCSSLFNDELLASVFSVDFSLPKPNISPTMSSPGSTTTTTATHASHHHQQPPPPPPPPRSITSSSVSSSSLASSPPPQPPPFLGKPLSIESSVSVSATATAASLPRSSQPPPPPPPHNRSSATSTAVSPNIDSPKSGILPPPPPTAAAAALSMSSTGSAQHAYIPASTTNTTTNTTTDGPVHTGNEFTDPTAIISDPRFAQSNHQLNLLIARLKQRLAIQVKGYIDLHFRYYSEQQQLSMFSGYSSPQSINPFTLLLNNQGYHHAISCSFIKQVGRGDDQPGGKTGCHQYCHVNDLGLCHRNDNNNNGNNTDQVANSNNNTSSAPSSNRMATNDACGEPSTSSTSSPSSPSAVTSDHLLTSSTHLLFSKAKWISDHRQEYLDTYYLQD